MKIVDSVWRIEILNLSDIYRLENWVIIDNNLFIRYQELREKFGHLFYLDEPSVGMLREPLACFYKPNAIVSRTLQQHGDFDDLLPFDFIITCLMSPAFGKRYTHSDSESINYFQTLRDFVQRSLYSEIILKHLQGAKQND